MVSNLAGTLQVNNQLSITGNYIQSAAATLKLGVGDSAVTSTGTTSDSGYGRLTVSGSATITAGSTVALVKVNSYAFAQDQHQRCQLQCWQPELHVVGFQRHRRQCRRQ